MRAMAPEITGASIVCSAVCLGLDQRKQQSSASLTFVKGIKNGCPCIVEIRGTQGCALVGDPARAVGECRDVAKAQT